MVMQNSIMEAEMVPIERPLMQNILTALQQRSKADGETGFLGNEMLDTELTAEQRECLVPIERLLDNNPVLSVGSVEDTWNQLNTALGCQRKELTQAEKAARKQAHKQCRRTIMVNSKLSTLSQQVALFTGYKEVGDLKGWARRTVDRPEHFKVITDGLCHFLHCIEPKARKGREKDEWVKRKAGWTALVARLDSTGCIVFDAAVRGVFSWDVDSWMPSSRGGVQAKTNFCVLNSGGNRYGKGERLPWVTPLFLPQASGFYFTRAVELWLSLWRGRPAYQEDLDSWNKRHGIAYKTGLPEQMGDDSDSAYES